MLLFLVLCLDKYTMTALDVVRKFKCIIHVSDLLLADGTTVDPFVLTNEEGHSDRHPFLHERSTSSDFELWRTYVHAITSPTLHYQPTIGPF